MQIFCAPLQLVSYWQRFGGKKRLDSKRSHRLEMGPLRWSQKLKLKISKIWEKLHNSKLAKHNWDSLQWWTIYQTGFPSWYQIQQQNANIEDMIPESNILNFLNVQHHYFNVVMFWKHYHEHFDHQRALKLKNLWIIQETQFQQSSSSVLWHLSFNLFDAAVSKKPFKYLAISDWIETQPNCYLFRAPFG